MHSRFGTKVAVLAGDFLFAQSSWFLANLDNLEVSSCAHSLQHPCNIRTRCVTAELGFWVLRHAGLHR